MCHVPIIILRTQIDRSLRAVPKGWRAAIASVPVVIIRLDRMIQNRDCSRRDKFVAHNFASLKKLESIFSFFYKFQPTRPLKTDPVRQERVRSIPLGAVSRSQ
jgi:hypothetical protein